MATKQGLITVAEGKESHAHSDDSQILNYTKER